MADAVAFVKYFYIFAEFLIVDFIQVAPVDVLPEQQVELGLFRHHAELVEYPEELILADVASLLLVEVLEMRLHEHSSVLYFLPVDLHQSLQLVLFLGGHR
jgi:hypothetical protein